MTNYGIRAKEKSGCCGRAVWGDHLGPGSCAETGRMRECQRDQEKRNTAGQTIPTRARRGRGWHFQGILGNEEEGTWETLMEEEEEEVSKGQIRQLEPNRLCLLLILKAGGSR